MIWGFTGTREGMSPTQSIEFQWLLELLHPTLLVHGDCVGADAQAHALAIAAGVPVHIRPSQNEYRRAYCQGATRVWPAEDPLRRNRAIVDQCDQLFAAPETVEEKLRSGTWFTVRYARKTGRLLTILKRDP